MNSLSRGFGVVSPAAGIRQQPARRIPASSKEASCALVHLDLPHGSVRRAIAERLVGDRRISGRLDQGAKKENARTRKKRWAVGSTIACHSSYIAGVTRQIRGPLPRDDYAESYRWITPTASLTTPDGPTPATRLARSITTTAFRRLDSPKTRLGSPDFLLHTGARRRFDWMPTLKPYTPTASNHLRPIDDGLGDY